MTALDQFRLDGRLALVTGGGRGLGLAAATALAETGATVVIGGRDVERLERAAAGIAASTARPVYSVPLDVADAASVERAFATIGRDHGELHVLVNNAGVESGATVADMDDESWDQVVEVNLTGTFRCCRAFARQHRETAAAVGDDDDRSIVNIASLAAHAGVRSQAAYCASKGAVASFTRALALELAPEGVRANSLSPGYFRTDMPAEVLASEVATERLVRLIPQRRIPEPAEIAGPIVFLASPASRYMTGADLAFDGGYTAQ